MGFDNINYTELIKLNIELGEKLKSKPYEVAILSNIIVYQSKEVLEYLFRAEDINVNVVFGDYDNIVQGSKKYNTSSIVIIFWEICNIIEGFQFKAELLQNNQDNIIIDKIKSEIDLVLKNLQKTSLILINKFTSMHFFYNNINHRKIDDIVMQLNSYLLKTVPPNVKLVDIEKVIASVGILNSIDLRFYYSSKALYTITFFKAYAKFIKPFFMSAVGRAKKALIFDCDNTLWKGIVGEDGYENIEMSINTKEGSIYAEIQSLALYLNNQGILIGLCSKNNYDDVDIIIKSHPDMQLREEHIAISKINWSDKISNLKIISKELNIGLDSIVFVDDSSFEVNLIKKHLPMVTVIQVPKNRYEYPDLFRKNMELFYNLSQTVEDKKKAEMYKHQLKREKIKDNFENIDDYLASLEIQVTIFENDKTIISRISQITQKTNQFNLTTKRYTEGDIRDFIKNSNIDVLAFAVKDKFGESGVTGLCIIRDNKISTIPEIDTLLMSCRIIGRNIEYVFMNFIIDKIKKKKIQKLKVKYIKSSKNEQVKGFYDECGFDLIERKESDREYLLNVNKYKPKIINYIEVINE